jgi:hypothetical protein
MNHQRNKVAFLPFVAIGNSIVLLTCTLWVPNPRIVAPVGLLLGVFTFYMVYAVPIKQKVFVDIVLLITLIAGSALSSVALFLACKFLEKPICAPAFYNAQIFGNFVFPLIIPGILWVTWRVPTLLGCKNS